MSNVVSLPVSDRWLFSVDVVRRPDGALVARLPPSGSIPLIGHVLARKAAAHESMKREMTAAMARAVRHASVLHDYQPAREVTLSAWLKAA